MVEHQNKTTLPMSVRVTHKVDYSKLEAWAGEQLGCGRVEIGECDNDSDHDFEVTSVAADGYDETQSDAIVARAISEKYIAIWEVEALLNHFAAKELIPTGNYIVNVSW